MNFNFKFRIEFLIMIFNFKFRIEFLISNFDFEFWNLRWYEHQRRGISLSTENVICHNRKAIFFACKISSSFADHSSKTSISKVDKFYTGLAMIIQKNRHVRTSSQNLIHFAIRSHRENIWVLDLNIADSKKNSILCIKGKKLDFSRRVWFRLLAAYHIFHNTNT